MKHSPSSLLGLAILFAAPLVPGAWSFEGETSGRAMRLEWERAAPAAETEWPSEEPRLLPEVQASPLPLPIERSASENRQTTAFGNGPHGVDQANNQAECFTFDDLKAEMRKLAQTIGDLSIAPYGHLQDDVVSTTEMAVVEGQMDATPGPRSPYHTPIELGPWGLSRFSCSENGTVPFRNREAIPRPILTRRRWPFDVDARVPSTFRLGFPGELSAGENRGAYLEGVPAATAWDWARW